MLSSKCQTHILHQCTWVFSKIDCILGPKYPATKPRGFWIIPTIQLSWIIPTIFSDQEALKVEINHKQKWRKKLKHLEINHLTIEQPKGQREKHDKISGNKWEESYELPEHMVHRKKKKNNNNSIRRKVCNSVNIHQKGRKDPHK